MHFKKAGELKRRVVWKRKLIGALLLLPAVAFLSSCSFHEPLEIKEFQSDGCTCFFNGTRSQPSLWREDCLAHDYAYWRGGSFQQRKRADLLLRNQIRRKGAPITAFLVYVGVRLGGSPWLPTPWRWGFGWNCFPLGYREWTQEMSESMGEGASSEVMSLPLD